MKGIKVYLDGFNQKPVSFEKVTEYKFKKGFLCITLADGKCICYNLSKIEWFEVDV